MESWMKRVIAIVLAANLVTVVISFCLHKVVHHLLLVGAMTPLMLQITLPLDLSSLLFNSSIDRLH